MSEVELDELDRYIVYRLQQNARKTSASTIAEERCVAASTVRNRIRQLEAAGVVDGYNLDVDYEVAGLPLHTLIVCTAPVPEREELARGAVDVDGVVTVREVMTGSGNVRVEAVGRDSDDLRRIGRELDALGLEIVDEDIIRNEYSHPYEGFAPEDASDE